ncbi:MAG: cysK [Dehalococcoidia bacterium]|nr:cysK [Dehalococcoidia bacterium]
MKGIVNSVLELIGSTPLVRLNRIPVRESATILAKLESLNPGGSIKDRIALAMIEDGEASGLLKPGDTIVEPTSGNTGIGLALVAAVKGYKVIIALPSNASEGHIRQLTLLGALVELTPADEGMAGAVARACRLVEKNPRYFMPQQFSNPANPAVHRRTTAREIIQATEGNLHAFVAAIGTGGTITGVGEVLKKEVPGVVVIGVEPARSPLLSQGKSGQHGISGIGANFIPDVLNRRIIDEIIMVTDEDAYETAAHLAEQEGILAGLSSGANVFAALEIGRRLGTGKVVATILPDGVERYLSLLLGEVGVAEASQRSATR